MIAVIEPFSLPRRAAELGSLDLNFRQTPHNFQVDEIPAYLPSGEGEHLFLHIRKQKWTTKDVADWLRDSLSISSRDIGYAGMKDRYATTTQWFSVWGTTEEAVGALQQEGIELLEVKRHGNKLRLGHLRGNRFQLKLEGVEPSQVPMVEAMLELLSTKGLPNFYGSQRFGRDGTNRSVGKAVLLQEKKVGRWRTQFLVSAFQSALFNDLLAFRLEQGMLDTALAGDRMQKHENGGVFLCTEPDVDQSRVDELAISPTGPMFGHKMATAEGLPGEWEESLLDREELTLDSFRAVGKHAKGTRRSLRVPLEHASCVMDGEDCILSFSLPPGSYASVVLHELGVRFS